MRYLGCILIGMLLGGAFVADLRCNHGSKAHIAKVAQKAAVAEVANIVKHEFDSVQYYRDLYNQEHADKVLIQGNAKVIRIFYKHREDSICNVLRIRPAQLQSMQDVVSQVNGRFTAPTQRVGELTVQGLMPAYAFTYKDDFIDEEGIVDSLQTVVDYHLTIPVKITTYWKRKWFLGRKHYKIDGYSPNKNVHITGLTGIEINK